MKKNAFLLFFLIASFVSVWTTILANSTASINARFLMETERSAIANMCYTIIEHPIYGYLRGDYVCDTDGEECPDKVANFMFPNGHICFIYDGSD